MPEPTPQQRAAKKSLRITLAVILITIVGSIAFGWFRWKRWDTEWRAIAPCAASGGFYQQPRLELKVPIFRQSDPRWSKDKLGKTENSLGAEGCAVASAAMSSSSVGRSSRPR